MSEPMYLSGDTIAHSNTYETIQEVECDCGSTQEIPVDTEYHSFTKETTWWGEWVCIHCGIEHESEGWY
jgi:hypothetical protein